MSSKELKQGIVFIPINEADQQKKIRELKLKLLEWLSPFGFKIDNTDPYCISFIHERLGIALLPKIMGGVDVCYGGELLFSNHFDWYDSVSLVELMRLFEVEL